MREMRNIIRNVIFGATILVALLLVLRFVLILVSAAETHTLTGIVFALTDGLLAPFQGLTWSLNVGATLDFSIMVAAAFYILLGILISGVVTAFIQDDFVKIIVDVIDMMFKFVEFLLALRFIFRAFGVYYNQVPAVNTVYDLTAWAPGLLPDIQFGNGMIELSTMLILIVVVVIDLAFEGLFAKYLEPKLRELRESGAEVRVTAAPAPAAPVQPVIVVPQPAPSPAPAATPAPAQAPQNITINVPVPVMQSQKPPQ